MSGDRPSSDRSPTAGGSTSIGTTTGGGAATPTDPVALVQQSHDQLLASRSFRFSVTGRLAGPFGECARTRAVEGMIDLDQQVATYDLLPGGPSELVVTKDSSFVKAAALPGWTLDRPWIAVPFEDAGPTAGADRRLATLVAATGVDVPSDFWAEANIDNPAGLPRSLVGAVSSASDQGAEMVRDVATRKYDLTIDRTKVVSAAGTSTTKPTPSLDPAGTRANRQSFLDRFERDLPGGPPPADVVEQFLDGDTEALIRSQERTTGTTMAPELRTMVERLSVVDNQDLGATMQPMTVASTTLAASVWIDEHGLLRRLELTIDLFGRDPFHGTTIKTSSTASTERIEYFDFGVPVSTKVPAASDVQQLDSLPASAIPPARSSC